MSYRIVVWDLETDTDVQTCSTHETLGHALQSFKTTSWIHWFPRESQYRTGMINDDTGEITLWQYPGVGVQHEPK